MNSDRFPGVKLTILDDSAILTAAVVFLLAVASIYQYLMVYTADAIPDRMRRRRSIAIEPMTCAPNAFRSGDGLIILQPGEARSGRWGILR